MNFKRSTQITAATLAVNFFLFTGLPNLLPEQGADDTVEQVRMVDFIHHKKGRNPSKQKNTQKKQKPPEPPRVVPHRAVRPTVQPTPQQLKMDMPTFDLDLPTDVAMGVVVAAPEVTRQAAVEDFYGMKDVDQAPVATLKTRPVYPYRARRLNLDGEVEVKFLVDTAGRVSRISILRASPKKMFDDSVRRSLSAWRFMPGKVKGRPVKTWVTTTIAFRIEDL